MNYIGSKFSLLNFLDESIKKTIKNKKQYKPYIFCDIFSGTGIVGAYFKSKGFKIISNDFQYYSYVINHCYQKTQKNSTEIFNYLNNLKSINNGFIYNNYCQGSGSNRLYFSDYNGKKIDTIRIEIENLLKSNRINKIQYYELLASLIYSADKIANTTSVYGAYLKKIKKSASKEMILEPLKIYNGIEGDVYNEDANDLIKKISGDILYLDPPYNQRQYSSNYHLLETIALYDTPEIKGKTGLRLNQKKSKFCSKKTAKYELEYLIKNANFKYVFLSYNNEGIIELDEIKEIFSKYGKYNFFTKEYNRYKSNKNNNKNIETNKTIEYLHCLEK